ncbi:MAG TPA: extracellular solute-binding protein [Bacteroidota bacterium]|nr:extracellular solute-binding protein [Bacteroidota bacterium]
MGIKLHLLAAIALFLGGCSDHRESAQISSMELTYWPAPNPEEIRLADTLVGVWNRLHPDIRVRMQPIPVSQSTEEVLLAAIAGKTTPDVCSNILPGAMLEYTSAGGLIALDEFSDFDSVALGRTPKDVLETFRSGDHYFQIPWKTNPVMMFYNLRLLEEAGITKLPKTYGEYLAAARTVTRDTNGDGQTDIWMGERDIRPIWWQRLFDFFPFYIAASGGKTLFENGSVAFVNKSSEEVFQFFQDCYRNGYFPHTYFQGGDPFLLEKKASHISGPWEVATLRKFAPQMRYDIVPVPVPDDYRGPVYTFGNFKNIAIFSTTRHPREAWEFVKFLITAEHDLLLLEICNQLPIRGDLTANPLFGDYFRRNPKMTTFARQAAFTREMDAAPDLKEIFDAISQEYEECCVYGKTPPAEAIRAAAQRTQLIVNWNK